VTVLFAAMAAATPDRAAVVDDRRELTWAGLDDHVTRLVQALRARGLAPGDAVASLLGNQVEAVVTSMACATGGFVLVPVSWHLVADELAYVLDDADAAAIVADARWVDTAEAALERRTSGRGLVRLLVDPEGASRDGWEPLEAAVDGAPGGELADPVKGGPMFYTSGTTGRPKGVRSSLTSVGGPAELFTLMAHSLRDTIQLPEEDPVLAVCGPMYHSAQWVFGSFSLLCGATLVLQHRYDAAGLLELVDEHRVTNLHLVPTQIRRILALPDDVKGRFDGSSLRALLHGAAPCPPELKRQAIDLFGPIVTEYYGGTEGGFLSTISATEWLERPGSVGRPLPIVEVVVRGEDGKDLPPGETGDVWFRNLLGSDFEYHKAPDKTEASHRDGFGTLGDIGWFDEDGYLYLSDRRIDMVVSGGVNIYPAEIEGVLAGHPKVADVAVFGVPHDEMGEEVKAAVVLAEGVAWDDDLEAELVAHCRAHLAGLKCPRSFDVHDALPRLESGKLTKRVLRDPYWTGRATAV
jgi:long-chain acyl-CoA synthetase